MSDEPISFFEARSARRQRERPVIRLTKEGFTDVAEQVEQEIIKAGLPLFRRGAHLAVPGVRRVGNDRQVSAALIKIGVDYLRQLMDRSAIFETYDARHKRWCATKPPHDIADLILAREMDWRFDDVAGIVTAPTLAPKGQLIDEPGFDPETRLYLAELPLMPLVPKHPTKEDARNALAVLNGLLGEFPFVDEASRSVALSAMITLVARGAIPLAPLHAASAPTPGSGKSFMFDVATAIATGRKCPVITMAKEEEAEKRIGGVVLGGLPVVSLDNITGPLSSSLLCQVLERPRVFVRILGKSDVVEIETLTTWFATGTNLQIVDDLTRRSLIASLDAGMERPELRTFQTNPVDEVKRERGRYIAACLTIVRAYIAADKPGKQSPLASYEEWSDLVRSPLVWLGCTDPCKSMETTRDNDPSLQERRAVFSAWPKSACGNYSIFTTAELVQRAIEGTDAALREALQLVASSPKGIDPTRLGKWFSVNKGRVTGDLKLALVDTVSGRGRWQVQTV